MRDVVVIGASRGGLEALKTILSNLPSGFSAAVLVVLHTSADHPGLLAAALGPHSMLPVADGQPGEEIQPGQVYLAPAGSHMSVGQGGKVEISFGPKVNHVRPAANPLFESAAKIFGSRVIGVVLTGGDGDGTDGLAAIHRAGGIGIVQEPYDAVDASMPWHAILGDHPSVSVPIAGMAALLVDLVSEAVS